MASIAVTFDTLLYANKLKEAGFNDKQAEIQAETLKEFSDHQTQAILDLTETQLVSKQDILMLKGEIVGVKNEVTHLRTEIKAEINGKINGLRGEMRAELSAIKWKLNALLGFFTIFGTLITLAQYIQ